MPSTQADAATVSTGLPAATVRQGLALTALLLSILLYVLWHDYRDKVDAAERQVAALAQGTGRALTLQMRNLERALEGIALDADRLTALAAPDAQRLRASMIAGVQFRHGELLDIALVGLDGAPFDPGVGAGDPTLPGWVLAAGNRRHVHGLVVGSPRRHPSTGAWVVPLAVPLIDGRGWVLAHLRLSALWEMTAGLPVGERGVANIFHRSGAMLARSRFSENSIGLDFSRTALIHDLLPRSEVGTTDRVSPVDGVRRILGYRALPDYPLVAVVGVDRDEVLHSWFQFAYAAALVCLFYAIGWWLLVRTLVRANKRQSRLLAELQGNRETLLEAQRIAGLGSWSIDLRSDAVEFSPEARAIYGFGPDETLTRQSCLERIHGDDRERVAADYARDATSVHVPEMPFRVVQPGGEVRSVIARGRAVTLDGGPGMVGTVHDITALARAQLQREEAISQYRLLFEHNPLPFWVFHRETLRILEANEAAIAQYGYTREQFQGMHLADIRPPEDVAEALAVAGEEHPESRRGRIWRHLRSDGQVLYVAVHSSDITFNGMPARLVLALDVTARLDDQRRLEESERRFQMVARATSDAVFDWNILSGESWRSDSFNSLFRYDAETMPDTIVAWRDRVHVNDRARVEASLEAVFDDLQAHEWQATYRFLRGDGSYAHVLDRGMLERDAAGKPSRMVGGMVDISRQHQDEAELRLLRRAIESTENGIAVADARTADMPLVYVNAAFERITGYSEAEAIGRNCRFLQAGDHSQEGLNDVRHALRHQHESQSLVRNYRKSGEMFYNQLSLSPVRDDDGTLTHFVGVLNDVTERQRYEGRLAFQASHDDLTGLLNRSALLAGLEHVLGGAGEQPVTLLYVDINNFKLINDSLGHEVGDEVLRVISQRLRAVVGGVDRVGRMGGNEFMIVLTEAPGQPPADNVVATVLAALAEPIEALSTLHYLSLNAGIARYPEHGRSPDLLFKNAGLATHEARRRGHDQLVEYNATFERAVIDRQHLVSRLHEAIERNEFELFFQPLFSTSPRQVIGLEALIRWHHPERGVVPPSEFISVCEDSGLIVPLGRWVLREACRYHHLLAAAGWAHLTIAVNVSAMQFLSGELQTDVPALLAEFAMPVGVLELELTESLVMENPESVIEVMRELREHGVLLSIDDFGTGYSSMSYLHRLPVDKLKIDRSFVTDVETDGHNAAICESILALARSFELKVIAEGVETQAQFDWLREHACHEVQGYLLARPQPFPELIASLESGRRKAEAPVQ